MWVGVWDVGLVRHGLRVNRIGVMLIRVEVHSSFALERPAGKVLYNDMREVGGINISDWYGSRSEPFFGAEVPYESELSKCKTFVEGGSHSKPHGMGQMSSGVV